MRRFGNLVTVGAILASLVMGVSDVASAKGNKSNIVGGPLVWMQPVSLGGNAKINKGAVKQLKMRGSRNSVTPIPIPRPR